MIGEQQRLDIGSLHDAYRAAAFTPAELVEALMARIRAQADHKAWISLLGPEQLAPYLAALAGASPDSLPLYGIPFAIKDNIDLAGVPTTAACPEFAYTPSDSATVVRKLIDAGAIPLGKTNLDQFATGLVGTRSPYGACRNPFDRDYIAGGSSSGSAVAVALGQVSFSLGTDTAGSGRVPAAFNNLIGVKPTRGLLSTGGVVPACRSLDCVSVFALHCGDAAQVMQVAAGYDATDAYARPAPPSVPVFRPQRFRFGVPRDEQLEFFDDVFNARLFDEAVVRMQALGGSPVTIDFQPFLDAAWLLYDGPWVSERYVAIEALIERNPQALLPLTRQIIDAGVAPRATDAFKAQYRLAACRRQAEAVWADIDVLLTPTAASLYRIDAVDADPLRLNARLGYYTHFMNLLDLAAVAVPAGLRPDGMPFGVTLAAPAFADAALLVLADRFHCAQELMLGATRHPLPAATLPASYTPPGSVPIAVCGAHLSGLALNHQLTERGALLLERTTTSACYRLYALGGGPPRRPGLIRDPGGAAIEVEVWALPQAQVGGFLEGIPEPLGLGKVELRDGRWVNGFICEGRAVRDAVEVTAFGGWRAYLATGV